MLVETALDFGDLSQGRIQVGGASEANGGLNDGYQGTRFLNVVAGAGRGLFAGAFCTC